MHVVVCYFLLDVLCSFRWRWCCLRLVAAGAFLICFVAAGTLFVSVPHVCVCCFVATGVIFVSIVAAGPFVISMP